MCMLLLFQCVLRLCQGKVTACNWVTRCPIFLHTALSQAVFSEDTEKLSRFIFIRVELI